VEFISGFALNLQVEGGKMSTEAEKNVQHQDEVVSMELPAPPGWKKQVFHLFSFVQFLLFWVFFVNLLLLLSF